MKKSKQKAKARKRVACGAAFLDTHNPDWRSEIDLDDLDLDDSMFCILGQLYGSYTNGLTELGIYDSDRVAVLLGFQETDKIDSLLLGKYWKKEIKKPRSMQEMAL